MQHIIKLLLWKLPPESARCGFSRTPHTPTGRFECDVVDYFLTGLSNRQTLFLLPRNLTACLPLITCPVVLLHHARCCNNLASIVWPHAWHINTYWRHERGELDAYHLVFNAEDWLLVWNQLTTRGAAFFFLFLFFCCCCCWRLSWLRYNPYNCSIRGCESHTNPLSLARLLHVAVSHDVFESCLLSNSLEFAGVSRHATHVTLHIITLFWEAAHIGCLRLWTRHRSMINLSTFLYLCTPPALFSSLFSTQTNEK